MRGVVVALLVVVAFSALCANADPAAIEDQVQAVTALIGRWTPKLLPFIELGTIDAVDGKDVFQIGPSSHSPKNITILGNNGVALASGFHWYLKYTAKLHISWGVNGTGNNLDVAIPPPVPATVSRMVSPVQWRYSWNVCTMSYTMYTWDWARWQQEIDFMAMSGINLPLSFTGQEYVWTETYKRFNLSEADIVPHFAGPAFLAWGRMGNLRGWGGPLSPSFRSDQAALQRAILAHQRELGMTSVLPCFAGHIPKAMVTKYPAINATRSSDWGGFDPEKYGECYLLEPTDPMFPRIGKVLMEVIAEEFGTDHIYNCDTYNEMDPRSSDGSYLAAAGKAVLTGIKNGDSTGKWLMQGWLFHSGFWKDPQRVKAYLSGISNDDMLILDLNSEAGVLAFDYESYFGKPFVWNMLHNYGGNRGVYGQLSVIGTSPVTSRLQQGSSMVGTGITPEAILHNPVMFDLMLEMGWRSEAVNVGDWVAQYAERRYHGYSTNAQLAWALLVQSAYSHGLQPNPMEHVPSLSPHGFGDADSTAVKLAWGFLLRSAAMELRITGPLNYDVVDVGRQVLANFFLDVSNLFSAEYSAWEKSRATSALGNLQAIGQFLLGLIKDVDALLGSDPNFLVGKWIADARALGDSAAEKTLQEFNARNQITLWGPDGNINDYAAKAWSGLVGSYYHDRWALLVSAVTDAVAKNTTVDQSAVDAKALDMGRAWDNDTTHEFPDQPSGDTLLLAQSLYDKYTTMPSGFRQVSSADHAGDDIVQAWTRDVGQLGVLCELDARCAGFNTDGFLKAKVDSPSQVHGCDLYVKA